MHINLVRVIHNIKILVLHTPLKTNILLKCSLTLTILVIIWISIILLFQFICDFIYSDHSALFRRNSRNLRYPSSLAGARNHCEGSVIPYMHWSVRQTQQFAKNIRANPSKITQSVLKEFLCVEMKSPKICENARKKYRTTWIALNNSPWMECWSSAGFLHNYYWYPFILLSELGEASRAKCLAQGYRETVCSTTQ
jgi:hypothetical protein